MNLSDITSWLTADETRINLPSSYHGDFLCPSNESNFPEWSEGLGCCRGVWLWAASRRPCVIRQTRYKQTWGWGDAEMLIHSVTCSTAYLHVIIFPPYWLEKKTHFGIRATKKGIKCWNRPCFYWQVLMNIQEGGIILSEKTRWQAESRICLCLLNTGTNAAGRTNMSKSLN